MAKLNNRQKYIPGGFKFYDAALRWTAPANASFAVIVDGLISARKANPGVTKARGLATDRATVESEVDSYNAAICHQMGWTDYYSGSGGAATPFPPATPRPIPPLQKLRSVADGSQVLVEWIASGAEAVPIEQAVKRAEICSKCPKNEKGGWERWFTIPVSNAIKAALNQRKDMKLSTPFDDQLMTCGACMCPIPLMVHVPLEVKLKRLSSEAHDALHQDCWILEESK